jgi:hypothetical protein
MLLAKDAAGVFHQEGGVPVRALIADPLFDWFGCAACASASLGVSNISVASNRPPVQVDNPACGEQVSAVSLANTSIATFTTLAQIAYTLSKCPSMTPSSAAEFRRRCNDALKRIISLAEELDPDVFRFMETFVSVCFIQPIVMVFTPSKSFRCTGLAH